MRRRKILIVDDENLVRWSLREKCEEWGYQVLEAENGFEGLRLADAEAPELVLLDVRLPDLGGLEVLEKLKRVAIASLELGPLASGQYRVLSPTEVRALRRALEGRAAPHKTRRPARPTS